MEAAACQRRIETPWGNRSAPCGSLSNDENGSPAPPVKLVECKGRAAAYGKV